MGAKIPYAHDKICVYPLYCERNQKIKPYLRRYTIAIQWINQVQNRKDNIFHTVVWKCIQYTNVNLLLWHEKKCLCHLLQHLFLVTLSYHSYVQSTDISIGELLQGFLALTCIHIISNLSLARSYLVFGFWIFMPLDFYYRHIWYM